MTQTLDLARDEAAPATARHALQALAGTLDAGVLGDAGLLVTELVANSVRHGGGERVRVLLDAAPSGALRCEVVDDGHGFEPAEPLGPAGEAGGGYGLLLVQSLSSAWGVENHTRVWFELAP